MLYEVITWSNACTIVLQVFVAARVIRWVGMGVTLAVLPLVAAAGFVWLGTYPQLAVLIA